MIAAQPSMPMQPLRQRIRPVGARPECSVVIPVFNASATLRAVVDELHAAFAGRRMEIILVNDGSDDASEAIGGALVDTHPGTVRLVQLARNFGEHNAVLAGLGYARGRFAVVLDDDGQHPPPEAVRLLDAIEAGGEDVVYGRYRVKQHGRVRNLGSWCNDRMATWLLGKPRGLYFSSFKVMNRALIDHLVAYRGARPYLDAIIYRAAPHIGQIDVEHRSRSHGRSRYNWRKLVRVWFSMLASAVSPLRLARLAGAAALLGGTAMLVAAAAGAGAPTDVTLVLGAVAFLGGLQLLLLGVLGEHLRRLLQSGSRRTPFVVRYVKERADVHE